MKKVIKYLDKPLFFLSLLLFMFGLVMIFSSSNVAALMRYQTSFYRYFLKQGIAIAVGFFAATVLINVPTKKYYGWARLLFYFILGLLIFTFIGGTFINDSRSWIQLTSLFNIQPSEFAKVLIIMYLASYYEHNKKSLDDYPRVIFSLAIPLILVGLVIVQDFGTGIIILGIIGYLFLLSPTSKEIKKQVVTGGLMFLTIGVLIITLAGKEILTSRQLQRFDLSNPCSYERRLTTGGQVCNSLIAINNGGIFGVGLGKSTQKYLYLPDSHTDFIFAIIVEELGLVAAFLLLLAYFLLIGRILKIAKESYNIQGKLICHGVAFYILIHIFLNLGGITGTIYLTGVPLPFMSYGGSYCLSLIMALMLVQRTNIDNKIYLEKANKKSAIKKYNY